MINILVTGGAGFIGSNFIRYLLLNFEDYFVVNYDNLTYAGNLENLADLVEKYKDRYVFKKGDITDGQAASKVLKEFNIDYIVNFAAESHVDRSIVDPGVFIKTNVLGCQVLLECAQANKIKRFVHISTDEVYGSLGREGLFTEQTPLAPNSPYAASKAGADLLCRSFFKTFELPVIITRSSNNYGPYQFPEKLIPLMISNALENTKLPVYGDGKNIRDWLYVSDNAEAIEIVMRNGKAGEIYNIGGKSEWKNIDLVKLLLDLMNKSHDLIAYVKDRPGHDRRYAIDCSKIGRELGWKPKARFEEGLQNTIEWYLNNSDWVRRVRNQDYLEYYSMMYENR